MQKILAQTRTEVQLRLAHQAAGHGFDHVQRVLQSAKVIAQEMGGDPFVIELAVLLHDVGDAKFHHGRECSGTLAREILSKFDVDEGIIEHVVHIVENISFRKGDAAEVLSLEGQIVQDADRLDALGAIGIVRTIEYGAAVNQPFYVPDQPKTNSGVQHFYDKLFKLRGLMNTSVARQLAEQRESFMRIFLDQLFAECGSRAVPREYT